MSKTHRKHNVVLTAVKRSAAPHTRSHQLYTASETITTW